MKKVLIVIFCVLLLSSCAKEVLIGDKLTDKATEQQQEQVKQEVLKLLEQEYNQPFKIVDYSYKYGTHWKDNTCAIASMCPKEIYGTYFFKVEAVNSPVIIMKFKINDKQNTEEMYDFFKKYILRNLYCSAFGSYWKYHKNDKNNNVLDKNIKYCNERGQKGQYDNVFTQN